MKYYIGALKKYASFSGRASRREFWMFFLFMVIACIVCMIIDIRLGTTLELDLGFGPMPTPYGYVLIAYLIITLLPGLALSVRRMHDINKTGWILLVQFIPIVGGIWLLVLYCLPGTIGDNQYGPDPYAEAVAA